MDHHIIQSITNWFNKIYNGDLTIVYGIITLLLCILALIILVLWIISHRVKKTQQNVINGVLMEEKITKKIDGSFGLQFVDNQGTSYPIPPLPVTIGRGEQNQIRLTDKTVSKNHARIYYDTNIEAVCIEDLGSLNGLLINDKPTRKNTLQDSVKVTFGQVTLTYRDTGFIPPTQ